MLAGVDVIGVDGLTALYDASLRTADAPDGGSVPVRVEESAEPACYDNRTRGFLVVPLSPLVAGARYELSGVGAQPNCSSPTFGAFKHSFVAPASISLPVDLPRPEPELLVQRCPGRPDYFYIDLAKPSLPAAPIEVRLAFANTLHYCQAHGWLGIHCAPGTRYPYPLHWRAGVPHTGVSIEGPRAEWEVVCDDAREVPCQSEPLAVLEGGASVQDASVSRDANTGAAQRDAGMVRADAGSNALTHDEGALVTSQADDENGCRLAPTGGNQFAPFALFGLAMRRWRRRDHKLVRPSKPR